MFLCELGPGLLRGKIRALPRPAAHGQAWGPEGRQLLLMTQPWGFEVLLLPQGSRHKQPRFIRYRFIWANLTC